jgi:hypothetical protein
MTGCLSGIFSSRSSKRRQKSTDKSIKLNNNEKTDSGLSAATPCYCIPSGGAEVYMNDKPPAYTPSLSRDIFRPEVLKFIEETVDSYNDELRELSLKIHGMYFSYK